MISTDNTPTHMTALVSSLIVSCMVACGMVTIVQLGSVLLPGWSGGYLVLAGFFISLEVFYTERFRKRLVVFDREWFIFYLSEWLVFIVLLKAILLLKGGTQSLLLEVSAWRGDFFGAFFNGEFLFSVAVIFVAWLVSLSFAAPLETLRLEVYELDFEEDSGIASERAQARRQLVDLVLLVGLVLVVLTSLLRSDRVAGWIQIPVLRGGVVNVMIYFLLGLVLLSLTQFSVLQVRWSLGRIRVSEALARRWALLSLLFLGIVAGVALWLPTGYTIGLLTLLNWLVGGVMAALALISWLVTALFIGIIALLGALMGRPPEEGSHPAPAASRGDRDQQPAGGDPLDPVLGAAGGNSRLPAVLLHQDPPPGYQQRPAPAVGCLAGKFSQLDQGMAFKLSQAGCRHAPGGNPAPAANYPASSSAAHLALCQPAPADTPPAGGVLLPGAGTARHGERLAAPARPNPLRVRRAGQGGDCTRQPAG